MIDLIYCAGGNPRLSQIAYKEGWFLGFRSDKSTLDLPQVFIDCNFKDPDFERHMRVVQKYHPKYAIVPDLSKDVLARNDIERALAQYEQLARICEVPLIVPKLSGQLAHLPADIAVGYCLPSSYGGATIPAYEYAGRRIHLLGGSPRKQMQAYLHLSAIAEVLSADGNYAHGQAVKYAMYWEKHRWHYHPLKDQKAKDLYLECWRWSCQNLMRAWMALLGETYDKQP